MDFIVDDFIEINQLMFIIHSCNVLLSFFIFGNFKKFDLILLFVYLRHVYLLIN